MNNPTQMEDLSKEEIIKKYTSRDSIIKTIYLEKAMQEYADQEKKKEAIALLKWLNRRDAQYAPMFDSDTWAGNEEDINSEQYYQMYCEQVNV